LLKEKFATSLPLLEKSTPIIGDKGARHCASKPNEGPFDCSQGTEVLLMQTKPLLALSPLNYK